MWLYDTAGNNLTETTVNDNGNNIGIGVYLSQNTNICGTYAENNNYGIYLERSSGSKIINNTLVDNTVGLGLSGSDGNTVVHNYINLSDYYGIYLDNSKSNLFYNNYLNNDYNVGLGVLSEGNTWNIKKTLTPDGNIIGGPYLAGNFYGSPDGYGFSQTTDSVDGIACKTYIISPGDIDELPLAIYPPGPQRPSPPPPPPPGPTIQYQYVEPEIPPVPSVPPTGGPVQLNSNSIPKTVAAGGSQSVSVSVLNNQGTSWGPNEYVTVQVWILDSSNRLVGDLRNIQVAPGTTMVNGEMKNLAFNMQMPENPGDYTINFQLWKWSEGKWVKIGSVISNSFKVEAKKSVVKTGLVSLNTDQQNPSGTMLSHLSPEIKTNGVGRSNVSMFDTEPGITGQWKSTVGGNVGVLQENNRDYVGLTHLGVSPANGTNIPRWTGTPTGTYDE